MRRREVVILLRDMMAASSLLWLDVAMAQQPAATPRVGYMASFAEGDVEGQARLTAFRDAMDKLGWAEGRNVHIDYRWSANNPERRKAAAADLVSLAPNVIVAQGSPGAEALRLATRSIPIVFVGSSDPFESGLVDSMAQPGGNLTGFANYEFSMGGKWLEILKEVAPGIRRLLVLVAPDNAGNRGLLSNMEAVAPGLGVELSAVVVGDPSTIERTIGEFAQRPNGGLIPLPHPVFLENRARIVGSEIRHRFRRSTRTVATWKRAP